MRNEIRLQQGLLGAAQRTRIREAARGPMERALVECLFAVRRAEAAVIQWAHIDWPTGRLDVPRGKGGTISWTLLLPEALGALREWQGMAPSAVPWVFPSPGSGEPGRPYTADGLGKVMKKLLLRAGCWSPGLGACHRFRRTFASEYLKASPADLVGLQRLMRHSRIDTTQRYVFLQPADLTPRLANVRL